MPQANLAEFLRTLETTLGAGLISSMPTGTSVQDVSAFRRTVAAQVAPRSFEEVKTVVSLAYELGIALYPISTGMNWGFGSQLPVKDDCVIVDLRRMNRIREIDMEFGYAVVEPGVTQRQLAAAIAEKGDSYRLDVTGSSQDSSVLGNALDRGIAYHSLRAENLLSLEVVLGNRDVITTGFASLAESQLSHLYRHGIGPSLDGLFLQSSFGVVTAGTVRLFKRQASEIAFSMLVSDKNIDQVTLRLRDLLGEKWIQGIPHIADRERAISTFAPMIEERMKARGESPKVEEVRRFLEKHVPSEWSLVGAIQGHPEFTALARRHVRRALKGLGQLFFFRPGEVTPEIAGITVPKALVPRPLLDLLESTHAIRGLTYGRPSNDGIKCVQWPGHGLVEIGSHGYLLCTPIAPLRAGAAKRLHQIAQTVASGHGFKPAVTLNLILPDVIEAVVSLSFSRYDAKEAARAQACVKEMTRQYIKDGSLPYRLSIEQMDELPPDEGSYAKTLRSLKEALDPKGIISPGRYIRWR